jgi:hypothetical protein
MTRVTILWVTILVGLAAIHNVHPCDPLALDPLLINLVAKQQSRLMAGLLEYSVP